MEEKDKCENFEPKPEPQDNTTSKDTERDDGCRPETREQDDAARDDAAAAFMKFLHHMSEGREMPKPQDMETTFSITKTGLEIKAEIKGNPAMISASIVHIMKHQKEVRDIIMTAVTAYALTEQMFKR